MPDAAIAATSADAILSLEEIPGFPSATALWTVAVAPSPESVERCVEIAVSESGTPGSRLRIRTKTPNAIRMPASTRDASESSM